VGVPGIGKSRLVYELFQIVEAEPELIYWRQGRSLPYGEGVTLWALAEIVKAQAGVLETDSTDVVADKLRQAVAGFDDEQWLVAHLRPLLGLETTELGGTPRTESFAAWRRFFEALAERTLLVLVFEDLQWADDGVLDFIDHLVEWASGVPILVVCTARPELLERRPGWGGGKRNASTVSLSPLSDEDTARLVAALLGRAVLPAETQSVLLAQAGGNALYAEQFVRMLEERGDEQLPLPETVQGIIAARLDGLAPEEKSLLQDAAVLGKVFWLGAIASIARIEATVAEERLHALERKEFVVRSRRSSVADETEYAFRHVLVRDVALGQIPRAGRAEKHRLAAEWIESLGRPEDHAEMLAHHYLSSLSFARAAGQATEALERRALPALREAGDRALALGAYHGAARFFVSALELLPETDSERPHLLLRLGKARVFAERSGVEELAAAGAGLLALGETDAAAEAEALLGTILQDRGEGDQAREHFDRAAELVEQTPASPSKGYVLGELSRSFMMSGASEETIRVGTEALRIAEALGLDELRALSLINVGAGKLGSGDDTGLSDLDRAIGLADAIGSAEGIRARGNLASFLEDRGDLVRARELKAEALGMAERYGAGWFVDWFRAEQPAVSFYEGRWEEALALAEEIVGQHEAGRPFILTPGSLQFRARIRLARGEIAAALEDATRSLAFARASSDLQVLYPALASTVYVCFDAGRLEEASELASELLGLWSAEGAATLGGSWVALLAVAMVGLGRGSEFVDAASKNGAKTRWIEAAGAFVEDEPRRAADLYAEIGSLPDEAYARLSAAEQLVAAGRRAEADMEINRALDFWRTVGATAYIRQGEELRSASA
jgi:tetratricopeptide (TPR) repeat protein